MSDPRTPQHPVDAMFPARWSPRAFSGEPVHRDALHSLFEAARWAPSANNAQPWRFVYGVRGTPAFDALFDLLVPFNQSWAHRAGALLLVAAKTVDDKGRPVGAPLFDTGAAWMSLALQARTMGLFTHAMGGFDKTRAPEVVKLPEHHEVICMVAVGTYGDPAELDEKYREREAPSDRKPVESFVVEGKFGD
jgi:nitroreductase